MQIIQYSVITFCLYLGTAECNMSVVLFVIQGCYSHVLRLLAKGLCRNEYGIVFLARRTGYSETNQTISSSRRELKEMLKKHRYWL